MASFGGSTPCAGIATLCRMTAFYGDKRPMVNFPVRTSGSPHPWIMFLTDSPGPSCGATLVPPALVASHAIEGHFLKMQAQVHAANIVGALIHAIHRWVDITRFPRI